MEDAMKKKSTSWGVIILLIIVFWPVGFFLLFKKITGDKTKLLRRSKAIYVTAWILSILSFTYIMMASCGEVETNNGTSANKSIFMGGIFCGVGAICLFVAAHKKKVLAERYKKYISIVVNHRESSIDNIATTVQRSYEEVAKDLQKMIDLGYFPDAYIDMGVRAIVLPQKYNSQEQAFQNQSFNGNAETVQAAPKYKVVVCKNCGANNKVLEGQVVECEFCGSMIQ